MSPSITVVGGGLAGAEAAWQLARRGHAVRLLEMRPTRSTPAHETADLAELVCSNSLKSEALDAAHGALKAELRCADSLLLRCAQESRVPAGQALAVDRRQFSARVEAALAALPSLQIERRELTELPPADAGLCLLASGPLTSDALATALRTLLGAEHLSFYDAIAPIVDGDSVDLRIAFWASRYGKGEADYLNCPMNRQEYETFLAALLEADAVEARSFEQAQFFEACQPVEHIARSGPESLTFGPLKPVGLVDPRTDEKPWAVVQLRREDAAGRAFNLVGFQTRLRIPEQRRVFRLIPGLGEARFLRYGSIHRNTYIDAPRHLNADLSLRLAPWTFVAGQLSGAEGYLESVGTGLLAALQIDARLRGVALPPPPPSTTLGSLHRHLTWPHGGARFSPSNVHWGMVEPLLRPPRAKNLRRQALGERAVADFAAWWAQHLGPAAEGGP